MKAPSKASLDFVQAIEDAVTDLTQLNVHVKTISQVHDAAQREVHDLGNSVRRFIDNGNWDLICRLAEAYLKVGLTPSCLTKALEAMPVGAGDVKRPQIDSKPLELQRVMPVRELPVQRTQAVVLPTAVDKPSDEDEITSLTTILRILNRLPSLPRRRVADQAYRWAGME